MNVIDTVTEMIENYPSLYETRTEALFDLFSCSYPYWYGGEIINDECDRKRFGGSPFTEVDKEDSLWVELDKTKRNAIFAWRIENARKIAQVQKSLARKDPDTVWMCCNRFADMPENVATDWKEAAIELAHALYICTENSEKDTHSFGTREKAVAFLESQGITPLTAEERNERKKSIVKEVLAKLRGKDNDTE